MTGPNVIPDAPRFAPLLQIGRSPRVRKIARVVGLAVLLGGAVWSVLMLELRLAQLSVGYLLLNLLILSPLNLFLAAVTLRITANALGKDLSVTDALKTSAVANVAELLPFPGGALVRAAALVQAGAGVLDSGRIITLTSVLTLAMTIVLSAGALAVMGHPAGIGIAAAGVAGTAGALLWIGRRVKGRILVAMVLARLATLALSVVRLWVSFAMLGMTVGLTEAALYTVATSIGSTVAIVPGGFGVNEAIAAGLAALVAGSAAAAFLAVATNRALGLLAGAAISFAFLVVRRGAP
jgi:hypothetical protein